MAKTLSLETIPVSKEPLQDQPRTTLIFRGYHQHNFEIHEVDLLGIYLNQSQEEPLKKRGIATLDPTPIDSGWLDWADVGFIVIYNLEGVRLLENPSLEEQEDIGKRIIRVTTATDEFRGWDVLPGLFLPGFSGSTSPFYLRSLHQTARYQIHVFPK